MLQEVNKYNSCSLDSHENFAIGANVKLIFEEPLIDNPNKLVTERMWVLITESSKGLYTGTINSVPCPDTCLEYGDTVQFSEKHIVQLESEIRPS